jgi:hypothetical protein
MDDPHALHLLTSNDLARIEHRARRFQGAWTGTAGTLAADVMRLLAERQRLLQLVARLEDQRDMWRIRGD